MTVENAPQDVVWAVGGHTIAVQTLDLAQTFTGISERLDGIAKGFFNVQKKTS